MSSGCERDELLADVVVVVDLDVVEGAGLKEEEVELIGEGSMEEAESMQRAESNEEVELFRLLDLRAFIHACCRHLSAVIRLFGRLMSSFSMNSLASCETGSNSSSSKSKSTVDTFRNVS